jgi:hypothetical protein
MKNCIDENCFDEGTIQAFLDGELAHNASETVATHIGECDACALMLAEVEEENSYAFAALDNEFNIPVPTHRLWTKINDEIEKAKPTFWQKLRANFSFTNPAVLAFASLLVVFGTFAIFWSFQKPQVIPSNEVAGKSEPKPTQKIGVIPIETPEIAEVTPPKIVKTRNVSPKNIPNFKIEKANFVNETPKLKVEKTQIIEKLPQPIIKNQTLKTEDQTPNLINGEDTYIKTIETLSKNVDSKKDQVLRPSARVSYERDIALVEQAIKTMQTKARKNPKDEGAKQILFASYQNKIDLLSSVAEKGEIIAGLR